MDNAVQPPVEGYPKLACHMGSYTSAQIFHRFSSLNCQNLLYLQAELVHLETKLRRLESADKLELEKSRYFLDWYWLNESRLGNGEQYQTEIAVRAKLKEYNEAVMLQAGLARLQDPTKHQLQLIREWLERPSMSNLALLGADRNIWGNSDSVETHQDLLSLSSGQSEAPLSRWLNEQFIVWFHYIFWHRVKKISPDPETGIVTYSTESIDRATEHITTIVASLLPLLAMVVLYFVRSMDLRLGLVTLFSVVFTVCVTLFTDRKRGEIFIATSTFAAVLVVFVSTGSGWNSDNA